ncbi:MAG: hypothetical protein K6G80_08320 [Treponema sp.]|nr:hypothetical protein [Treponema sp.]
MLLFSGAFFVSCGLDVVYALDEPTQTYNLPTYQTENESDCFVDFRTVESSNGSDSFIFLGTAIYYKIYNNYTTLQSQVSAITSADTSSNAGAASKMITTYTYQPLGTNYAVTGDVFVASASSDRRIRLRLKNINDTTASSYSSGTVALISHNYDSKLYIGYKSGSQVTYTCTTSSTDEEVWTYGGTEFTLSDTYPDEFVFPYRYDNTHSFDFFDNDDNDDDNVDIEPKDGDSDYYMSSSFSEENKYYVQLFAVGVARDTTYTLSYSKVLNLGTIPIWK